MGKRDDRAKAGTAEGLQVGLKQVTRNEAARAISLLDTPTLPITVHRYASQGEATDNFLCASIIFGRYDF